MRAAVENHDYLNKTAAPTTQSDSEKIADKTDLNGLAFFRIKAQADFRKPWKT